MSTSPSSGSSASNSDALFSMTLVDWIFLAVVFAGLVGIGTIVIRKFPLLSAIDLRTIAKERHREVKEDLLEGRVRRKFSGLAAWLQRLVQPHWQRLRAVVVAQYDRLIALERSYRERLGARSRQNAASQPSPEWQRKVAALFLDARRFLEEQKVGEAEKRCIEIISLDHDNAEAYELLVDVYRFQEEYGHARDVVLHLIKLAEMARQGRPRQALSAAVAAMGKRAGYFLDAGLFSEKLGDLEAAVAYGRRAVEAEPNNPKTLDALVRIAVAAHERAIAQDAFEKLERANPENQKLDELRALIDTIPARTAPKRAARLPSPVSAQQVAPPREKE